MNGPVLCLGTTPTVARTMHFRRVEYGEVNRATYVHEYAAGKAVNVARVVKTLGGEPVCLAFVGGWRGWQFRELLNAADLRHATHDVPAPTRLCVTVIDDAAGLATELVEESPPVSPDDGDRLFSIFDDHLRAGAAAAVLSGSLAGGLPADFTARSVRRARESGVWTLVDASGTPLRLAVAERPDVVKVNASELSGLATRPLRSDEAILAAAREVAAATGGWCVVTRGASPTIATDGRDVLTVAVPRVEVVSPIGGGDTFAAGLAVGHARGLSMAESLRLATAAAAANATSPHAAHVSAELVDRLLPQVEAEPL